MDKLILTTLFVLGWFGLTRCHGSLIWTGYEPESTEEQDVVPMA